MQLLLKRRRVSVLGSEKSRKLKTEWGCLISLQVSVFLILILILIVVFHFRMIKKSLTIFVKMNVGLQPSAIIQGVTSPVLLMLLIVLIFLLCLP
jgi:hypothetical protein